MSVVLFLSHSSEDKLFAKALRTLFTDVFGTAEPSVEIEYSSDDAEGGGIDLGDSWLKWILDAVRRADICVVVLTEHSVAAPWVTWEAGAVTGVATEATRKEGVATTIVPLLFGIDVSRIPAPLRDRQAGDAQSAAAIRRLLTLINARLATRLPLNDTTVQSKVERFVADVGRLLDDRLRANPRRFRRLDQSAVRFVNAQNGLTAQPYSGNTANGIRLYCEKFTASPHQSWGVYPVAKGLYRIATADDAYCLSVENDSTKAGATILLWEYMDHLTQHWRFDRSPGEEGALRTVRVVNTASGLCLFPRNRDGQIVLARIENYREEDWWMLAALDPA